MDISAVKELIAALENSCLNSLTYENGPVRIALSKSGAAPDRPKGSAENLPHAGPDLPVCSAAGKKAPAGVTVPAPIVGTVYRARGPGQEPIVSAGDSVHEGDPLCLIEAMKMFSEITAPCSGIIREITFSDGQLAEYGMPLLVIDPL